MPGFTYDRQSMIDALRAQYAAIYPHLNWVTPQRAAAAEAERRRLLEELAPRVGIGYQGTKLDCRRLSPGCLACGQGTWSCLFVNQSCNGTCFYCPAPQHTRGVPSTSNLDFNRPAEYVAYLEQFGFTGVGISGGEPLLTLDRTLRFIGAVRRHFGERMYIWLYSNGLVGTPETYGRLRDSGIDEIRFNIGATGYDLRYARQAVGVIPRVTVEIPCVPEELPRLQKKVGEMQDAGIAHLNLHQLRCTAHNYAHLLARGYTFLHGLTIAVLESELAALALLRHAVKSGVDLPVNYCSATYRGRYQGLAARRRWAPLVARPYEDLTSAGLLRCLSLKGGPEAIGPRAEGLRTRSPSATAWQVTPDRDRLYFKAELWPLLDFRGVKLAVSYAEAMLLPTHSYRNPFREIRLTRTRTAVVERVGALAEIEMEGPQAKAFGERFLGHLPAAADAAARSGNEAWDRLAMCEAYPSGLMPYF